MEHPETKQWKIGTTSCKRTGCNLKHTETKQWKIGTAGNERDAVWSTPEINEANRHEFASWKTTLKDLHSEKEGGHKKFVKETLGQFTKIK